MTFRLLDLPAFMRQHGLIVKEIGGWQQRGHGDMNMPSFIVCHHTASPAKSGPVPPNNLLAHGRPDLSGPLCNLSLGEDGIFYMVAAGKAYHAGTGKWMGIENGNLNAVGIEAKNNGVNEPWPRVQMQNYERGCAVICKHYGLHYTRVCGHKEYALPAGRKIDPDFDMVIFRKNVHAYLAVL